MPSSTMALARWVLIPIQQLPLCTISQVKRSLRLGFDESESITGHPSPWQLFIEPELGQ